MKRRNHLPEDTDGEEKEMQSERDTEECLVIQVIGFLGVSLKVLKWGFFS